MEKSILVALDDSPRAVGVLDAAIEYARAFHASLVLGRVISMPALQMSPEGLAVGTDLTADLEKKAHLELNALSERVPKDIPQHQRTILDIPWQGIVELAKKEDVELIVLGSHSYGALDRLLGTTAAKVVNHADRSVMVVRGPEA